MSYLQRVVWGELHRCAKNCWSFGAPVTIFMTNEHILIAVRQEFRVSCRTASLFLNFDVRQDKCILVEGYLDVLSMHQPFCMLYVISWQRNPDDSSEYTRSSTNSRLAETSRCLVLFCVQLSKEYSIILLSDSLWWKNGLFAASVCWFSVFLFDFRDTLTKNWAFCC